MTEKTVHIRYYAILREQRGIEAERLVTRAATPAELYEELRVRHGFTLAGDRVRAALNDEFTGPGTELREGDRIVFIPPIAGG
jgi:molybdopterin converting factor small subunit